MSKKLRVLNLEDSARDAVLLQRHLERSDYEVIYERVETRDAMQAALETKEWDIILSDFSMPQFGTLAALALLKESGRDIPFIIVSGTIGEESAVEAMLSGAHDYLMKGKLARLLPAIERELQEAENRRARRQAEEALKSSEAELRALFAAMTDVIFEFDVHGCCKKIAPTNPADLYRPLDSYLGQTLYDIFSPVEAEFFLVQIRRALAEGRMQKIEYCLQFAEQEVWFEGSVSPLTEDSVIWIARDITERKRDEEQLKAYSEQLRALSASLSSAREEEGIRIAREIHDELGSLLTGLRWEMKSLDTAITKEVEASQAQSLREKITTMLGLTDRTIRTVRRIAAELRPSILDDFGLTEAIEWQAQEFQTRTGIPCHCQNAATNAALNKQKSTAVFRIFQESLTNVLRHAQATQVDVAMAAEASEFVLTICDNGRGITAEQQSGMHSLGLLGMRERAHLVGGEIKIMGNEGGGTLVTVRVPTLEAEKQ
jgi:two-component system, NarL family, sensor histidine kinase UhpB